MSDQLTAEQIRELQELFRHLPQHTYRVDRDRRDDGCDQVVYEVPDHPAGSLTLCFMASGSDEDDRWYAPEAVAQLLNAAPSLLALALDAARMREALEYLAEPGNFPTATPAEWRSCMTGIARSALSPEQGGKEKT